MWVTIMCRSNRKSLPTSGDWAAACSCVLVLIIMVFMHDSNAQSPSPTCNPTYIEGVIASNLGPSPMYHPNSKIQFTILAASGGDWPTTATSSSWVTWNSSYFRSGATLELDFPSDVPPSFVLGAGVRGNGVSAGCQRWTSDANITLYRYDYFNLTPTPTPSPSETPSPTPTYCTPPVIDCEPLSPHTGDVVDSTTAILEYVGFDFLGLETGNGSPIPTTQLGPQRYLATGLTPDTFYVWYYVGQIYQCPEDEYPSEDVCIAFFRTAPSPTPTTTPTPSSTAPTPTPAPTTGGPNHWRISAAPPRVTLYGDPMGVSLTGMALNSRTDE